MRYAFWPTTFSSKSGFQASRLNDGRAAIVRDEDGTRRYPIVFGATQLHGLGGEAGAYALETLVMTRRKMLVQSL